MSCWEILGIDETTDLKVIKRAYAKKLKVIDIDVEVAAFQELKEAFERAKQIAKLLASDQEELSHEEWLSSDDMGQNLSNQPWFDVAEVEDNQENDIEIPRIADTFDEKFLAFIDEGNYFAETSDWVRFLNEFLLVDIDSFVDIQDKLYRFALVNYVVLSREVRDYLDELCHFQDRLNGYKISNYPDFNFSFWQELPRNQRKNYFLKRAELYSQFSKHQSLGKDFPLLLECQKIYSEDPTLALFEAYLILWDDFRLKDSQTMGQINQLSKKMDQSQEGQFVLAYAKHLSSYRQRKVRAAFDDSVYTISVTSLANPFLSLFMGYLSFLRKDKQATINFWHHLTQVYPAHFTNKEKKFVAPEPDRAEVFGFKINPIYVMYVCGVLFLAGAFNRTVSFDSNNSHDDINIQSGISVSEFDSIIDDAHSDGETEETQGSTASETVASESEEASETAASESDTTSETEFAESDTTSETADLESVDALERLAKKKKELEKETVEMIGPKQYVEKDGDRFSRAPNLGELKGLFEKEDGTFAEVLPDYSHYLERDVINILGEPDEVLTEKTAEINEFKSDEMATLLAEKKAKHLTENDMSAFSYQFSRVSDDVVKVLRYKDDRPNVFLSQSGKVLYITPLRPYVSLESEIVDE